jgi:hypothetical protein
VPHTSRYWAHAGLMLEPILDPFRNILGPIGILVGPIWGPLIGISFFLCICVYTYRCVYIYMYIHIYIYIYVRMFWGFQGFIWPQRSFVLSICMVSSCLWVSRIHIVSAGFRMFPHVFACTNTYIYIYTYTHIHIYTYINWSPAAYGTF